MRFFQNNFLSLILTILFVLLAASSYLRFVHNYDYMVTYEADCNPATESCFVGCEDEECTSKYYYKYIYKYAANLYQQCGIDITDCSDAQICLPTEQDMCYFKYCDPAIDECSFNEAVSLDTENIKYLDL